MLPGFVGRIHKTQLVRRLREEIDKALYRLYKDSMKTLTITDAKKNLSRWLDAAVRGQDIGIIRGAEIIALRRVDVESTDYAQREYGATPEQIAAFAAATDKRYRRLKRSGKLVTVTTEQLRNLLE
jgi:antitoxin (DNA-binding transcriptional repressor) of toxin-antitoxin stability system